MADKKADKEKSKALKQAQKEERLQARGLKKAIQNLRKDNVKNQVMLDEQIDLLDDIVINTGDIATALTLTSAAEQEARNKAIIAARQAANEERERLREEKANRKLAAEGDKKKIAVKAAKGGGGGAAGGFLGGIFGAIGTGIGAVGGGIGFAMRGLAYGLASLGKNALPALIGIGVLSAFLLAMVGVGFVAAKAFEKSSVSIAEGLRTLSADDIDTEAVLGNAKALAAFGAALAVEGFGSAVSGVGNLIGGLADNIGKLFGLENDPLGDLKEFAAVNFTDTEIKNIEANSKALTAFGKAMVVSGAGKFATGFANMASAIFDSVTTFFGGKTGLEGIEDTFVKIKAFAKEDLSSYEANIVANARILSLFQKTLADNANDAKGVSWTNLAIGVIDAVTGFFGGATGAKALPIKEIKEFAGHDLAPYEAKITANAKVLTSFQDVMLLFSTKDKQQSWKEAGVAFVGAIKGFFGGGEAEDTINNMLPKIKTFANYDFGEDAKAKVRTNAQVLMAFMDVLDEYNTANERKSSYSEIMGTAFVSMVKGWFGKSDGLPLTEIQNFASTKWSKENADNNVLVIKSLLAMTDYAEGTGEDQVSRSANLKTIFTNVGEALKSFSKESFKAELFTMGASIAKWITGKGETESPVQAMLSIADRADDLDSAATALDKLRGSLTSISSLKIDTKNMGIKKFAEDLMTAVPMIEASIMGSDSIDKGMWGWVVSKIGGNLVGEAKWKGLASEKIDYAGASKNLGDLGIAAAKFNVGALIGAEGAEGGTISNDGYGFNDEGRTISTGNDFSTTTNNYHYYLADEGDWVQFEYGMHQGARAQ